MEDLMKEEHKAALFASVRRPGKNIKVIFEDSKEGLSSNHPSGEKISFSEIVRNKKCSEDTTASCSRDSQRKVFETDNQKYYGDLYSKIRPSTPTKKLQTKRLMSGIDSRYKIDRSRSPLTCSLSSSSKNTSRSPTGYSSNNLEYKDFRTLPFEICRNLFSKKTGSTLRNNQRTAKEKKSPQSRK